MTTIVRYADHNCCLFVNLINDVHNIYGYTAACRCMTSLLFSYMLILFSWKEIELRNVFILLGICAFSRFEKTALNFEELFVEP